ncbi:MAG: multiheme c-type cytochrome [Bacteroidales bacterium]
MKFKIPFLIASAPFVLIFLISLTLPDQMGYKGELPGGYNDLFAGSGECVMCHENIETLQGESVSITSDWRSTMMANASKDPLWRAKVSHEIQVNPQHAVFLEDVCTKCHAPMGNKNAHHNGQSYYTLDELDSDPLALDGVSCTACHQITEESLGIYSGNYLIGTEQTIWGPYEMPFANPMINFTGYTPAHSDHIKDSRLCGSCHTLITETLDLEGVPTGTEFVEQAIYHEWLNSSYPETNTSCQTCHVPEITDEVVISTMPPWLDGRVPFGMHHLVGANVFMLKILKNNADEIGVNATAVQFDSTIARANRMIQNNTIVLNLSEMNRTDDTLFLDVSLTNMAGHKFPAGFPSRRAFVSLYALDLIGDTIFYSGKMDNDYNIIGEDEDYESHYSIIRSEDEIQIYELVMGDVNLNPTTVLTRAYVPLKDNRIPPDGFLSTHLSYDTVLIAGSALEDVNFNKQDGVEGSGNDIIHYHIPINGSSGAISIYATVYYQTVSARWLEDVFTYETEDITTFKSYYEEADKEPVTVAGASLVSVISGVGLETDELYSVSPNPATDFIYIRGKENLTSVEFYSLDGKHILSDPISEKIAAGYFQVAVPYFGGVAIMRCTSVSGYTSSHKIWLK